MNTNVVELYCPLECVVAGSPTLEESYRRATIQGPIRERGLTQISRTGNPKRQLPNCQAGPTASSTPLLLDAQMPWSWAPSVWQARWLPPFGDCGSVASCHPQKPTRREGDDSDGRAGDPEENEPHYHQKRYSRTSVDCINTKRDGGPKTPLCEGGGRGGGPRTLASRRHSTHLRRILAVLV